MEKVKAPVAKAYNLERDHRHANSKLKHRRSQS